MLFVCILHLLWIIFSFCLAVSEGGVIIVAAADCLIFIFSMCALFLHNLFSVVYCALVLFD